MGSDGFRSVGVWTGLVWVGMESIRQSLLLANDSLALVVKRDSIGSICSIRKRCKCKERAKRADIKLLKSLGRY